MKKHSVSEKQAAVNRYAAGDPIQEILNDYSISRSTLYTWAAELQKTHYHVNLQEFRRMEQRCQKLENMIQILRTASCFTNIPYDMKLSSAEELHLQNPALSIPLICEALELPKGTVYNRLFRGQHGDTEINRKRSMLKPIIEEIYHSSHETYGAGRIAAVLQERGYAVSREFVARIMHDNGMFSVVGGSKKLYEQKRKQRDNILRQSFTASRPNEIWVSDVTYYHLQNKRYYICVILDLYARKVVSWKISVRNSTQLTKSTFKAAYEERKLEEGLIFHSDNGGNYICKTFASYLRKLGVQQSFSKKGTPHDNAVCESFFRTLKSEELYRKDYTSERDMKSSIAAFMTYYNDERLHSVLHYRTPSQYEAAYYAKQQKNSE